jgi:hypothetical protein
VVCDDRHKEGRERTNRASSLEPAIVKSAVMT